MTSVWPEKRQSICSLEVVLCEGTGTQSKLNPSTCAFGVRVGILLGHIVSKEGLEIDTENVRAIHEMKTAVTTKEVERSIGKVKWHIKYLDMWHALSTN